MKSIIILFALSLSPIMNAQGYFPTDALYEYRQKVKKRAQQKQQCTTEDPRWEEEQQQQNDYYQIQIETAQDIFDPRVETSCTAK
jgi:hypothetical protein